jgi:hypothetical protein
MPKADSTDPLVEVFTARDATHAYMVKMGLDAAGIFSVIQGASLQDDPGDAADQAASPRILVRQAEIAWARRILKENGERS